MKQKHIILLLIFLILLSSCSVFKIMKAFSAGQPDALTKTVVPLELSGNNILIQTKLNGDDRIYTFIFDTGAVTSIDQKLADSLGLKVLTEVSAGDSRGNVSKTKIVEVDRIRIGDNAVNGLGVLCLDFGFINDMFGRRIDGIIGNNFVKFFTLTLDYEAMTLGFEGGSRSGTLPANAYDITFKQTMEHGHAPEVDVILPNGRKIPAIVDCGNSGSIMIPEHIVYDGLLDNLDHIISKGSMSSGASGISENYRDESDVLMRLESFDIWPMQAGHILAQSTPGDICLIGYEFLSNFIVVIDYPAMKLVLIPREDPISFPTNRFETGMGIARGGKDWLQVVGVWEHSPAADAGIVPGDTILTIEGRNAVDLTAPEIYTLLRDPAVTSLKFDIKKDGIEKNITLEKRNLLP